MEIQGTEDPREVLNWLLTRADEEIDKARNREAVWGPSAEAVTVLEQVAAARKYLDQAEAGAVALLREDGAPWEQIGTILGVTKQAAQQRFRNARIYRLPAN